MRVPMVRREQKVVQPFSKDDLTTLLAACNPKTYVGSRMRAMILFLLDTGVRSSELVSIELCDVLFDEGRVRVLNGKGRKQRWTAISEVAARCPQNLPGGLPGLERRPALPDLRRPSPSQSPHERHVHPSRGEGWGEAGQPPPLPSHVCYLGNSGQCPRARCPVFAWSLKPDDGPSLFCDLRLRAGGKGARCLQPGDAAVGEVRRIRCVVAGFASLMAHRTDPAERSSPQASGRPSK